MSGLTSDKNNKQSIGSFVRSFHHTTERKKGVVYDIAVSSSASEGSSFMFYAKDLTEKTIMYSKIACMIKRQSIR